KRRNTFLWRRFDLCCRPRRRFGRKQRPKLPQGCKVFWDQLLVLNPITEFIFQKCHQTDQTERVNLQRLVRISYWWQRTAIVIYVLFEFRWYLQRLYRARGRIITKQFLRTLMHFLPDELSAAVYKTAALHRPPIQCSVVSTGELGSQIAARSG